jgi:hypothetical protein
MLWDSYKGVVKPLAGILAVDAHSMVGLPEKASKLKIRVV